MRGGALRATLVAVAVLGCATPVVRGGAIQPGPYREVLDRTTASRGLELETPVRTEVIHRRDIEPLLRALIAEQLPAEELAAYQEGLVTLALWPADRDLADELIAVSGEEIGGLYAPLRRTLYVVADVRTPFRLRLLQAIARRDLATQMYLAHELVHALQHQAYPELIELRLSQGHDDAAGAVSAALEGDAVRYGYEALELPVLPDPEDFGEQMEAGLGRKGSALARAPAAIRLTLYFPYVEGYRLSYLEGPRLLDEPPASTEQVLHPALRYAPFQVFDLTPLADALPAGCEPVSQNDVGELGISVFLRDLAGEGTRAEPWLGWDGDRYLAARCGEEREFLWLTAWDSETDAQEFESAYVALADEVRARAGLSAAPLVRRRGSEVVVHTPGLAALEPQLAHRARRARVSTVSELRAHFAGPAADR